MIESNLAMPLSVPPWFGPVFVVVLATGILLDIRWLRYNGLRGSRWQEAGRDLLSRSGDIRLHLFLLAAVVAIYTLTAASAMLLGAVAPALSMHSIVLLQTGLLHGGILLCCLLVARKNLSVFLHCFGLHSRRWLKNILWGIGVYIGVLPWLLVVAVAWRYGLTLLDVPLTVQHAIEILFPEEAPFWHRGFMLITAVVLVPILEELVFRGLLLPVLLQRMRVLAAVFISSLFFAILHWHLLSLLPLFLMALIFNGCYLASGSLLTPIMTHAVFNAVSLLLLFALR